MDHDERQTLAQDRAEKYAPAPTGGSLMAGVCTAAVLLGGDFVVSGFYGWKVSDNLILAAAVTLGGFFAGMIGYKRLARTNRRAVRSERSGIDDEQGGPRA
jgi:hypothetical protein